MSKAPGSLGAALSVLRESARVDEPVVVLEVAQGALWIDPGLVEVADARVGRDPVTGDLGEGARASLR